MRAYIASQTLSWIKVRAPGGKTKERRGWRGKRVPHNFKTKVPPLENYQKVESLMFSHFDVVHEYVDGQYIFQDFCFGGCPGKVGGARFQLGNRITKAN